MPKSSVTRQLRIGSRVNGSTASAVPYIDASKNLAQDQANFSYDDVAKRLALGGSISAPYHISGNYVLDLGGAGIFLTFDDYASGIQVVNFQNGDFSVVGGIFDDAATRKLSIDASVRKLYSTDGTTVKFDWLNLKVNGVLKVLGGSSSAYANVGGVLFDHYADAGNTGTGDDDLYSDTIAASLLGANGDKITATYQGIFVGAAASTQELRIKFGPSGSETTIYDSGALSIGVATDNWTVQVAIIRVSSSVVRCSVSLSTDFGTLFPYSKYTEITGLTLSNAQVLKVTGEAAGVGAANNQIVAKLGYVKFEPAA